MVDGNCENWDKCAENMGIECVKHWESGGVGRGGLAKLVVDQSFLFFHITKLPKDRTAKGGCKIGNEFQNQMDIYTRRYEKEGTKWKILKTKDVVLGTQ